jgi:hypothetical protein
VAVRSEGGVGGKELSEFGAAVEERTEREDDVACGDKFNDVGPGVQEKIAGDDALDDIVA